jgi:hypothetical protein
VSEKKFKYLNKDRQIDLNRLLHHTITTYGLSAILEQLADLLDGSEPYEKRLVADLKKTLTTYEDRYKLEDDFPDDYEFDK